MLFTDLLFLYLFLPVCIAAYFFSKKPVFRNIALILFSFIFYAWAKPLNIILLFFSALVNYLMARFISAAKSNRLSKLYIVLALVFNIGMLGVFKYTDFFISNINGLFGTSIPFTGIALPLGISFYTFQALSYILDVYWEKVEAQRSFYKLLMYISLFPQLVAGPIVRYETIENEVDNRRITVMDISSGISRFIIGLSKKVLLANNLFTLVNDLFGTDLTSTTISGTWIGIIAYSLYVYFDFSGYSDMAIGLGQIFGFHFNENFFYPFICRSISEFWQRWHISLGSFFRDYLFFVPIFGKRRKYFSLFLVWFTTGLWHGASWNYVIWGLYFGLFIFLETLLGKKRLKRIPTLFMHIYNKLVIIIGFGIFRFTDMQDLGNFFKNLVGLNGNTFINDNTVTTVKAYIFIFLIAIIVSFPIIPALKKFMQNRSYLFRAAGQLIVTGTNTVLLAASTIVIIDSSLTNNPFLYWIF